MRKIILFNMITLDGYFEGPDRDISWHTVDEEFNDFAIDQLNAAGGLIFGRITYELMYSYWPTPAANQDDPGVAGLMNSLPKYVFSRTLGHVEWNNTKLLKGDAAGEVAQLKEQPGKDLFIFGSGILAASLTDQGLIDEYRLMVSPIVLGRGRPLFEGVKQPLPFTLVRTRSFRNGNVLLVHEPARQ